MAYDIIEITILKDRTSITIYHDIEVPSTSYDHIGIDTSIGIEYGRARHPALQAVLRYIGHKLQCT